MASGNGTGYPNRLGAHRVNLYELMQKLGGDGFQLSGGRISERGQVRYVRSLSRFDDPFFSQFMQAVGRAGAATA